MEKAEVLLSLKHGIVRLDNVWGVGGGLRPVKTLMKKVGVVFIDKCAGLLSVYLRKLGAGYRRYNMDII